MTQTRINIYWMVKGIIRNNRFIGAFENNDTVITFDLGGLDTSQVNNMRAMFNNCVGLTSLDAGRFQTEKNVMFSSRFNKKNVYS